MRYLFLFIIIVPSIEIGILLLSGILIGVLPTVVLIVLTGFLGAFLAKRQGLETVRKARLDMQYGQLPGDAMLDGICVLAGGVFLLAPGFVTDAIGLLLLIPVTRRSFKKLLQKAIMKWFERGKITIIR